MDIFRRSGFETGQKAEDSLVAKSYKHQGALPPTPAPAESLALRGALPCGESCPATETQQGKIAKRKPPRHAMAFADPERGENSLFRSGLTFPQL